MANERYLWGGKPISELTADEWADMVGKIWRLRVIGGLQFGPDSHIPYSDLSATITAAHIAEAWRLGESDWETRNQALRITGHA